MTAAKREMRRVVTIRTPGRSRRTLAPIGEQQTLRPYPWARPAAVLPPTEPRADLWPPNAGPEIRSDPMWQELLRAEGGIAVGMRIAAEAERRRLQRDRDDE
jgi:hypothetical protein